MQQAAVVFAAGLGLGSAVTILLSRYHSRQRQQHSAYNRPADTSKLKCLRARAAPIGSNSGVYFNAEDAPAWLQPYFSDTSQRRVLLREWEDAEWRQRAGWHGTDLIHSPVGRGVQVLAYFWHAESSTLTGIVRFGPEAESHRGLCHGGAMTSLMDDLAGHICFFASSAPWCGATVQVNCKLTKPVRVGDVLKVVGRVYKRESKERAGKTTTKIFMSAELVGEGGAQYASLEGLSVTPVAMSTIDDAVDRRSWILDGEAMCDSGWLL